ncbi:hypothetical protein MOX02_59130 [Methylobacterium oxalidis]|uniref:Phasin domain-containing protein n=1 Tax=Methylobacterium oxalidis TaxID=944322 RepID=A0A512JD65_9HYPH|nr:hypothetical protein MOX02_59130 [Methylobacterium oxalidis]GLS62510.1 hypothetical protein GCM10007888_08910 [Methylobacterium oxalidis]
MDMNQTGRKAEAERGGKPSEGLTQKAAPRVLGKDVASRSTSVTKSIEAALHKPAKATEPVPNKLLEKVSQKAIRARPAGSAASKSSPAATKVAQHATRDGGAREPAPSKSTAPSDIEPAHAEPRRAASARPEQSEAAVDRADPGTGTASATASNQPQSPAPASSEVIAQGKGAQPASGWRGRTPAQAKVFAGPLNVARAAVQANVTVWSYLRKESEAAVAHFRALSSVKSPTDAVALQAREMARAVDAALSLGQDLASLTTGPKSKQ